VKGSSLSGRHAQAMTAVKKRFAVKSNILPRAGRFFSAGILFSKSRNELSPASAFFYT